MSNKTKKTTGPLSKADKFTILEETAKGSTAEEIAEKIGKSEKSVNKAILENKVLISAFIEEEPILDENNYEDSVLYTNVVRKLKQSGVETDVAKTRLNILFNKMSREDIAKLTEEALFNAALNNMSGRELFINKSSGSERGGLAVMTKAASEAADDTVGRRTQKNVRDCIHKIS